MTQKNILFTVGAAVCIMAALASIGWVVAGELRNRDANAPAADTKRGPAVVERTESNEIIVKDKVSAKQMLETINADMGDLEKTGL